MVKSIELSFVFLSCLQVLKVYTSNCDSGSNDSECCWGFTWNHSLGKCISCTIGFIGSDCKLPCRYPSYGRLCQSACDCPFTYCNHIYGCINPEDENTMTSLYVYTKTPPSRTTETPGRISSTEKNSTTSLYVYTKTPPSRTTETPGRISSTENYQENPSTERYHLKTDSLTSRIVFSRNYIYSQSQRPENEISTNTMHSTERILEAITDNVTKEMGEQITCHSVTREHTKKRGGLVFLVLTLTVLSVFLMMFYLYVRTIQGGHQLLEII